LDLQLHSFYLNKEKQNKNDKEIDEQYICVCIPEGHASNSYA